MRSGTTLDCPRGRLVHILTCHVFNLGMAQPLFGPEKIPVVQMSGRSREGLKVKPWCQDWLIAAGAYPGFCSMKRLGVFLLPLDGMLVYRRSLPHNLFGFPNNSPAKYTTVSPARARTYI